MSVGDGRLIGWCNRCGRECFDGVRHVCPQGMSNRINAVVIAARQLVVDWEKGTPSADSENRLAGAVKDLDQ